MSTASAPLVVTGAGGWIGRALLDRLAHERGPGWHEGVRLFGSAPRTLAAPDGTRLDIRPLAGIGGADVAGAEIVHLAYLTKEQVAARGERAFFETNTAIDETLLAAMADARPKALFVASSGAAALAEAGTDRHLYGVCKLLQEDRFLAWGRDAGVPVLAGRIFNIAGAHINKIASYAISNFIDQARRTGAIRIAARVPVYRAYLHVDDLAGLVLAALRVGYGADRAVDLCGAETVEMVDLAQAVARHVGIPADAILRDPVDHDRTSIYLGRASDTRTLALRFGLTPRSLAEQIATTDAYLTTHPGAN